MIYTKLTDLIGNTPLLEVSGIEGAQARILIKLESWNPGGSSKDRVALAMIEDAEAKGILKPGATIIEPTSGNTGIGLAWVAIAKGYKTILTMPDTMSAERRNLLKAYGAQLELTPGAEGMAGSIRKAEDLKASIPGSVILGQFDNPANPAVHEHTTGEEIWRDTEGHVDYFVAGVGTGGTLCGSGRALKKHNPSVKVIAVEPASSPVISKGIAGAHKIQGIGANFVPKNYDPAVVDMVNPVTDDAAYDGARCIAAKLGLLVGISAGAAFSAAVEIAKLPENAGKTVVALMPDSGERYLSTTLFQ